MNFTFQNVVLGLIGMGGGFGVLYSAYYLNHQILFLGWVENKWGPGMGTTAYRLIGFAVMVFSFFVLIGQIDLFSAAFGGPGSGQSQTQRVQVQQQPSSGSLLN
jgi:hypothetical protein